MKVLVLSAFYPTNDGKKNLYYVHSRNIYYKMEDIDVTELNFSANEGYIYDGIKVISLKEFEKQNEEYDVLICHASNLRNHYRFLMKYGDKFNKKIFVFHGQEILHRKKYYPKPYEYVKNNKLRGLIQNPYDDFKIAVWRKYWLKNIDNIRLVFVSNWIYKQFLEETKCTEEQLKGNVSIISNSIGKYFENNSYNPKDIEYDFITVRANLDDSKYGVDIVVDLATKHPEYKFCILGNGKFFDYREKPDNVIWLKGEHDHEEIAEYLDKSRYALLPTREDTQGLMGCEMVSYGIPLITSDIEICREVFDTCKNTVLISNEKPNLIEAINILEEKKDNEKWTKYYAKNTIYKEIEFIKKYCKE